MGDMFRNPGMKKFIHAFDNVRAIMYFVNLCDYDQDLEDHQEVSQIFLFLFVELGLTAGLLDSDGRCTLVL
jgi:hypothetical protein